MTMAKDTTKKKEKKLSFYKKKAWKIFSEYIRRKDAGSTGLNFCITCGVIKMWNELQAGHYVDGHGNSVMFNEMLVHPQCFRCNAKRPGCLAGNKVKYTEYMMKTYKLSFTECLDLENLKFQAKDMTKEDYQNIEQKYKQKIKELENGKNTFSQI